VRYWPKGPRPGRRGDLQIIGQDEEGGDVKHVVSTKGDEEGGDI